MAARASPFQFLIAAIRSFRVEELAEILAINFDSGSGPNLMDGWRPENPERPYSPRVTVIENGGFKNSSIFSLFGERISDL